MDTANAATDETAPTGDFEEGMSALAANHLDLAEDALRRGLRSDPRNDEVVRALGLVAERQGKTHSAQYWYRRYLQRVPKGVHSDSVRQRINRLSGRTR
jgi:regulator of sirC expression with transglutaminase-like and TPR domain